jgi:hypothetical protein
MTQQQEQPTTIRYELFPDGTHRSNHKELEHRRNFPIYFGMLAEMIASDERSSSDEFHFDNFQDFDFADDLCGIFRDLMEDKEWEAEHFKILSYELHSIGRLQGEYSVTFTEKQPNDKVKLYGIITVHEDKQLIRVFGPNHKGLTNRLRHPGYLDFILEEIATGGWMPTSKFKEYQESGKLMPHPFHQMKVEPFMTDLLSGQSD